MAAGGWSALIEEAVDRLAARREIAVVQAVVVDHPHRAVLRATDPTGALVYVKVEVGSARSRREVDALDRATRAGIPVPRLRHAELGERSLLVLGEVPGRPLSGGDDEGLWHEAAAHAAALHRLPVPEGVERFDHREAAWLDFMRWWVGHEAALVVDCEMLDRTVADRLHGQVEAALSAVAAPPRVLLHGDLQPAHVLVAAGRITGLIDWGDASTGDPLWDAAVLTAHHPHRLPLVLAAIGATPDASDLVHAYWVVRHLGSATWMADHGFDPSRDLRAAAALAER